MATKSKSAKPVKATKTTRATKATKSTKGIKILPPPPRKWNKCHKRFIGPELRRRGLPTWGDYSTLVNRLKATDAPILRTPEGRKAEHARKVKRLQNAALKATPPFPFFSKLPLEIREQIWELSLPGPRVLTLDTSRKPPVAERLWFSRVYGWTNPAALKTCRESRAVALRRYKLAFGTPNVYFDFEGGDILFWGPECMDDRFLDLNRGWHGWPGTLLDWQYEKPYGVIWGLNEEVRRDLESVRHIALSRKLWPQDVRGELLRKRLRKFKAVERISLEYGKERFEPPHSEQVFYVKSVIEDPWFEKKPRDWRIGSKDNFNIEYYKEHCPGLKEWLERDGKSEMMGGFHAFSMLWSFDVKDLSEEEMEKGIPEARVVDIKFVPDEPRRVREEFWRSSY